MTPPPLPAPPLPLPPHPSADDYDPKITTPPGLYWAGAAWAAGWRAVGLSVPCSTASLRYLSAALGGVAAGAAYDVASGRGVAERAARAAVAATLPFYAFFGSLYYTETASVAAVLLCLAAARRAAASPGTMSLSGTCVAVAGRIPTTP